MKALVLTQYKKAGLDTVVLKDLPQPQPTNSQVLVRLKAAAFNPADLHIISGEMKAMSPNKAPFALGVDGAGVVESVGSGVSHFKVGDEVMFYTGLVWSGTVAEYIAVDVNACAIKPASWTFEQAAAAALGLLCARQALNRAQVKSGQHILIHGGGGAVGAAAIVLAQNLGATVDTTANVADTEYLKSLGVHIVFDYKTQPLTSLPKAHYDMVLDGLGDETLLQSLPLLKKTGVVISLKVMTGVDDMARMGMNVPWIFKLLMPLMFRKFTKVAHKAGVQLHGVATYQDGKTLEAIAKIAEQKSYLPRIDRTFALNEAKEALEYFANSKTRGKVVVRMD
ncbi:oxidoreductase [Formosimonas limnophila]|uniref:Oxidoreductase n=1 Tax=Formosimonas limnophila TaxID=1384487 RepID=A0A8J3CLS4_9BURK|nr:NADP-dependent oxidoreductase [Formosimonas limnophila]GHA75042.1 oxidoreductase [Formosimonas limnophila]